MISLKIFKSLREVTNTEKHAPKNSILKNACISAGILAACSLIGLIFFFFGLSEANIMSIYILGILLISALTSKMIFGIISSVAGMILFNCLYADPIFNWLYYDVQYIITAIIMLVASLLTGYIMTLFKHYLANEKQATRRSNLLLEASQSLQQVKNTEEIFDALAVQLQRLFNQPALYIAVIGGTLQDPVIKGPADAQYRLPEDWSIDKHALENFIRPDSCTENPLILRRGEKKELFFKIQADDEVYALAGIIINATKYISEFELNLVAALIDEVTLSLEKYRLQEFNERILHEAEMERLRANLLRTISHDLRTPLTSISGSADMLLNNADQLDAALKKQMYQNIYDDAEWLIALVENLLFTTRIENGGVPIKTEPELLQDIIAETLSRLGKRTKSHIISVNIADGLLMAKIDARLIIQVVTNLVINAVKYTPPGSHIVISAFRQGEQAVIEVADDGPGVRDIDKEKIFDMFYTANNEFGDGRRGIGLGLSLCKSIIKAHGGTIYIRDNHPSGAVLGITLQAEEVHFENFNIGN